MIKWLYRQTYWNNWCQINSTVWEGYGILKGWNFVNHQQRQALRLLDWFHFRFPRTTSSVWMKRDHPASSLPCHTFPAMLDHILSGTVSQNKLFAPNFCFCPVFYHSKSNKYNQWRFFSLQCISYRKITKNSESIWKTKGIYI